MNNKTNILYYLFDATAIIILMAAVLIFVCFKNLFFKKFFNLHSNKSVQ